MSATPISTDYVRESVSIRKNFYKKLYSLLLPNHLKYTERLEETQITVKLTKYRCCREPTTMFRKINTGLNIIQYGNSPKWLNESIFGVFILSNMQFQSI